MEEKRTSRPFELSRGQAVLWEWPVKRKIYLACAGEQGGKTSLGARWFRKFVKQDVNSNYIVGAPTYKIMEQATKPAFLDVFRGLGQYNKADSTFKLRGKGMVYLRSSTDPDSVVGITDCRGAWIDEGGKCPRMFFYNIKSRVGRRGGPVLITTTPYALNWVKKDVIDLYEKGDETILYSEWPSNENPTYPLEQFEYLKKTLPYAIFQRRLLGIHSRMEGLIFDGWSEDNIIDASTVDLSDAYLAGAIDWGFDHPFALNVRAYQGGNAYGLSFFKGRQMSSGQMLDLIENKHKSWGVKIWSAGADRPDMIAELNRRGIPCVKYFESDVNYREVDAGNQKHLEFIKTKKYKVFREAEGLADLVDEYETYHWDSMEEEEKGRTSKPVKVNDDLMDTERYNTVLNVHRFYDPKVVIAPEPNEHLKHDTWRPGKVTKRSWDAY